MHGGIRRGWSSLIDTSILLKVMNVGLIDTREMIDINSLVVRDGMPNGAFHARGPAVPRGHFDLQGVSANLAGSIESYQAQQLWALIPSLTRLRLGERPQASTLPDPDPTPHLRRSPDAWRRHPQASRHQALVGGWNGPAEDGGGSQLPASLRTASGGVPPRVRDLIAMLADERGTKASQPASLLARDVRRRAPITTPFRRRGLRHSIFLMRAEGQKC